MADHSELKRLADTLLAIGHREDFGVWITALEAFEKASGPEAVLALLAENEALRGLYRMHKMTETREMRDVKAERDALLEVLSAARPHVAFAFSEGMEGAHEAGLKIDHAMSREAGNV